MFLSGKFIAALIASVVALGGGIAYFSQQQATEPEAQQQALAPQTPAPDAPPTEIPATEASLPESAPPAAAEPDATTTTDGEPTAPEAVPSQAESQDQPEEASAAIVPEFDVLRVDEDGNVVVAGRAAPGASVDILIGAEVAATETAGDRGEFAVVLDEPLDAGTWPVRLRATAPDGTVTESTQEVTVVFEAPGEEPLVVAQDADGPTEVLQEAAPAPEETASNLPKGDEASPVLIRTVDVRPPSTSGAPNQVVVAGTAPAGSPIRVYLQDEQVGVASTSESGDWIVSFAQEMSPGRYVLRADQLNPDTGEVMARAQTRFRRAAIVAENAPASAPAAPVEEAGSAAPQLAQTDDVTDSATGQQASASQTTDQSVAAPLRGTAAEEPDVSVVRGDSLWRIARNAYGRGVHYTVIFEANRSQITDPSLIFPGQVFTIPEFEPGPDDAARQAGK